MPRAQSIYFPSTLKSIVESGGATPSGLDIPVVIRIKAFKPDANYKNDPALYEVFLPVPVALNNSYNINFDNLEVGIFGTILAGLSEAAGKLSADQGIGEAFTSLSDSVLTAGGRLADSVGLLTPAKRKFGFSFNKFSEMVISRPGNRSFNFSFDLAPSNKEESASINNIVNLFKLGMQPTTDVSLAATRGARTQSSSGFSDDLLFRPLYRNPMKFTVDFNFRGVESNKIFKTAPCFITALNVNYHRAGAPSYLTDGQPTMMSIDLSMSEIFPLNRESLRDIEGLNSSDIAKNAGPTDNLAGMNLVDLLNIVDDESEGS